MKCGLNAKMNNVHFPLEKFMKISSQAIEEYRKVLDKDPNSKVFAPLSEALREQKEYSQAQHMAEYGIKRHPQFVGGYVALGRVLTDQAKYSQALPVLKKATELDPQNLLALQLLGNTYLQLQMSKEALKTFKMVLFLNPLSEKAKNAVQKLETFSAEDFEEDVFQYSRPNVRDWKSAPEATNEEPEMEVSAQPIDETELDRKLSLVDALIVRNQFERAHEALNELAQRSPGNPEIASRFELLEMDAPEEQADDLQPLISREKMVVERKRALLEGLLQRIRDIHQGAIDL